MSGGRMSGNQIPEIGDIRMTHVTLKQPLKRNKFVRMTDRFLIKMYSMYFL